LVNLQPSAINTEDDNWVILLTFKVYLLNLILSRCTLKRFCRNDFVSTLVFSASSWLNQACSLATYSTGLDS
jgi:hypothetical protein